MFNWFKKKRIECFARLVKNKANCANAPFSCNCAIEFKDESNELNMALEKINQAAEQGAYSCEFEYISDTTIANLRALGFFVERMDCEIFNVGADIVSWEDV